jgi:hypothetical protein
MAVTALVYGGFLQSLANKEIDLDTDVLKVMLCTSTYTPNQDTHKYKSSVTNEVTGTELHGDRRRARPPWSCPTRVRRTS